MHLALVGAATVIYDDIALANTARLGVRMGMTVVNEAVEERHCGQTSFDGGIGGEQAGDDLCLFKGELDTAGGKGRGAVEIKA